MALEINRPINSIQESTVK